MLPHQRDNLRKTTYGISVELRNVFYNLLINFETNKAFIALLINYLLILHMKQLLLYFLYFVVSSLIFLQCAKMFPSSPVKTDGHKSASNKNQNPVENTLKKETSSITPDREKSLKSMNIWLMPDDSSSPDVIMMRASEPNQIYNPYFNFKNYKLAFSEKWQRY